MNLVESLTEWLEASRNRGGVYSMAGWSLVVKTRKQLAMYFNVLADAVPLDVVSKESLEAHVDYIVTLHSDTLRGVLTQAIFAGYTLATGMDVFNEATTTDRPDLDRPPSYEVMQYAVQHAAELVTGIDATTRKLINDAIVKGLEQQLGVPGTAAEVRKTLQGMTTTRAKSIATTEMNSAMSQATLDKIKRIGLTHKRWVSRAGACPICRGNTAQGAIPVDQAFKSGQQRPPGHPGKCRCALVGADDPDEETNNG